MKLVKHFLLIACLVLIAACSTKLERQQKRAQKFFNKAVALDPSIYQNVTRYTDLTNIKDSTRIKDSIRIIPKTIMRGELGNPCDSVTGKFNKFDYTFGSGPTKLRIWSDGTTLRYDSQTDSLISRIYQLENQKKEYIRKTQTIIKTIKQPPSIIYKTDWLSLIGAVAIAFALGYVFRPIINMLHG